MKERKIKIIAQSGDEFDMTIGVKLPTHQPKTHKLTQEDVWGKWSEDHKRLSFGMIVAQGYGEMSAKERNSWKGTMSPEKCPVWKDRLPYKSVTVICDLEQEDEVAYWLEYVHGGNSISRRQILPNNKVAMRSDYQCW